MVLHDNLLPAIPAVDREIRHFQSARRAFLSAGRSQADPTEPATDRIFRDHLIAVRTWLVRTSLNGIEMDRHVVANAVFASVYDSPAFPFPEQLNGDLGQGPAENYKCGDQNDQVKVEKKIAYD
jgi:hypothetical protein